MATAGIFFDEFITFVAALPGFIAKTPPVKVPTSVTDSFFKGKATLILSPISNLFLLLPVNR